VVKNLRQFTLGSSGDRGGSLGAPARGFGQRKFMSEGYFGANDESDEDADGHNVSFDTLKPSFKSVSKFQTAAVRRPTTNTCCCDVRRMMITILRRTRPPVRSWFRSVDWVPECAFGLSCCAFA